MDFNLELPLNTLSFGQISVCILRELHKRNIHPHLFPIGNVDVRDYRLEPDFKKYLEDCINKSVPTYKRSNPGFKLWHLQGSHTNVSKENILFTFHEPDEATPAEINIVNNHSKVLFSSHYSKEIFEKAGCANVDVLPLGFDESSFKILDKKYLDGKITFGLAGKLEPIRKAHKKVIRLWAKKYGNKEDYVLNCALYNPHLNLELQDKIWNDILEGKKYYNINRLPFIQQNEAYNDYLNSNNIVIDMGRAEGWSLCSFQSVCLGKHAVVLNGTGMKEWATEKNAVLVEPTGKVELYDNIFFRKGLPFNQGNGLDFTDEDFYEGINKAIDRFKENPINKEGLKLRNQFTYTKMVDKILETLNN